MELGEVVSLFLFAPFVLWGYALLLFLIIIAIKYIIEGFRIDKKSADSILKT